MPRARNANREFAAGEVLFHEGGPALGCYIVLKGQVQLSVGSGKNHMMVDSVGPGELVGISALLGGKNGLTATAVVDTSTIFVSRRDLLRCLKAHPEIRMLVLTAMSGNVQRIMRQSAAMRFKGRKH